MQPVDRYGKSRARSLAAWTGVLAAAVLLSAAGPARAQSAQDATASAVASQEVRIQQLQQQLSDLNGKLEDANFQIKQLTDRLDKMQKDVEFRLNAMEQASTGGAGAQAPVAGGAGTATAPAGSAEANPPPPPPGTQILGTLTQGQLQAAETGQTPPPAPGTVPGAETQAATATPYDLPGNTPQEQYEYAFGLLRQANYAEAEKAFMAFIQKNPTDVLAGNAQYWLGETFYVRGDYQKAAVAFAEGFQKYPNSGKAADNLLKLGMSLGEMGKKQDACTALTQLLGKYPGAPEDLLVRARREKEHYGCS